MPPAVLRSFLYELQPQHPSYNTQCCSALYYCLCTGEYLRRCWATLSHPYDSSSQPWVQFKPLIADDRFFYIERAPSRPNSQHVTLDLLDMLRQLPRLAHGSFKAARQQAGSANGTAAANGAGPSSSHAGSAGASSSRGAGGSSASRDVLEVDDEEEGVANPLGVMLQASSAAAAAVQGGSAGEGSEDPVDALQADIAALEALSYAPPTAGEAGLCVLGVKKPCGYSQPQV